MMPSTAVLPKRCDTTPDLSEIAPVGRVLWEKHKNDLYGSGLSPHTIQLSGCYSVASTKHILGFEEGPGLAIPYPDPTGGVEVFVRVKLDKPGTDGKRYRSPVGSKNRLYIPPNFEHDAIQDASVPLYLTEGEKKALKACQEGLVCLALAGVWCWKTQDAAGRSVPIPDLDRITWEGRTVTIVFDSDLAKKPNVQRAETALAEELARRGAKVFAVRLPQGDNDEKVGLDDYLVRYSRDAFDELTPILLAEPPRSLGTGLGTFLSQPLPPTISLVDTVFSSEGGGWIAGEEKLGKTFYALEEGLCLALGLPVCGKFAVPQRRRVLFIEEEDSSQRMQRRMRGLLRGHDRDPDDPALQAELDAWFRLSVWDGVSLDIPASLANLECTIAQFEPHVVYLDALRKLTLRDINKTDQASAILSVLDGFRRKYNVLFRVLHHFRKSQQGGFRNRRGSQEISGSFVFGAWGENSLFFSPCDGAARVTIQTKDGRPQDPFRLVIDTDGDDVDPRVIRLRAEAIGQCSAEEDLKKRVLECVATLPKADAITGQPGVPLKAICVALKRKSDKPVREALAALTAEGTIAVVGTGPHGADLWGVVQ